MPETRFRKNFIRGTAVKFVVVLDNLNTATTATITIDDPTDTEKVASASMTKDADKVYSYVWQSATTNLEGPYVVTFSITSGSFTTVKQDTFILNKQAGSE